MLSGTLELRAPAKVNLYLEVRGRRSDGYHELRMFLAPVSLCDELRLSLLPDPGRIEVECRGDPAAPSGEGNLCHRAARYYFAARGVEAGARVDISKVIPSGAGLGGGSSDAAAVILGLERLCGEHLSDEQRREAAFALGADVPFFFARSAAWVEGIGEVVRPAPLPQTWLVLVYPGRFLSTASVFAHWSTSGLTKRGPPHSMLSFPLPGDVDPLRNDLQPAALALEPAVGEALRALGETGARQSLMSGSGSAVFGVFGSEREARSAAAALAGSARAAGWRIEAVRTLAPDSFPF